ncbi:hypothetical protein AB0M43_05205 [Longispora sp. NPDC051575]|uniref:hypothetical protein n=1 Tax=Longispora sp. NPDC051575 TaxID=3154943 RepID=UPI00341B262B
MRRFLLATLTILGLAVLIPASVLAAAWAGPGATHWSGAALSGFGPTGSTDHDLPDRYVTQLGPINDLLSAHSRDLAGWRYDGDRIVVLAATDTGERLVRDTLRDYPLPWRVERVRFSDAHLQERKTRISNTPGLLRATPSRLVTVGVDPPANCVLLVAVRLDHDLFNRLDGYEDEACVRYAYAEGTVSLADNSGGPPATYWDPATLPGTYLTLLTGFPWHIAAGLLLFGAPWVLPALRRRARARAAAA